MRREHGLLCWSLVGALDAGPTKGFWGLYGLEVPSSRTVHPYFVHGELVKGWGPGEGCCRGWVAGDFLGEPGLAGLGHRCCGEGKGVAGPYTDDSHCTIEGIR